MDLLPSTVLDAASVSASGDVGPKTHVRGINLPREGCNWSSTLSNPGRHLGFQYTYDETVVDRQKVTNLRLPGQYDERLLGSLGLQGPYYNWNRWYLPGIGRYLELDPLGLVGELNTDYSVEWYGYAEQNPLRYMDPTGLVRWELRAGGDHFDVHKFLSAHAALSPEAVFRKGERRTARSVHETSGFNLTLVEADDWDTVRRRTMSALKSLKSMIKQAIGAGARIEIDVGIVAGEDDQFYITARLSPEDMALLSESEVDMCVTVYVPSVPLCRKRKASGVRDRRKVGRSSYKRRRNRPSRGKRLRET